MSVDPSEASRGRGSGPIQLTLHSFSFFYNQRHNPKFDVWSFIDIAVEHGFSGIVISAYAPDYIELSGGTPAHLARVRRKLEANGLTVDIDNRGTDPDHLGTVLATAQALGARSLRTYVAPPGTPEEYMERSIRDLGRAAEHAARAGIPILFENHEELTGEELARVLRVVDSPWVGAIFDYGNSMPLLEEPQKTLDAILPWVRMGHLKDHVMVRSWPPAASNPQPCIVGVPAGQGNIPVVDLSRRLVEAGCRHLTVQNVWGYRFPIQSNRGGARLGEGTFRFIEENQPKARCFPDAAERVQAEPELICDLERGAFRATLEWLVRAFPMSGLAFEKSPKLGS